MNVYLENDSNRNPPCNVSIQTRTRVDAASVLKHCLIENVDEYNAVEYAYCLPGTAKNDLLDALEFWWDMPRFSLNPETRLNVMLLTPSMHNLLNRDSWLLLPEVSIIEEYLNTSMRRILREGGNTVPKIPGPPFNYRFVPHPRRMKSVSFFRRKWSNDESASDPAPLSENDFTRYSYPFKGFPTITSHVHPRFVICNSGRKLRGDTMIWADGDDALDETLQDLMELWIRWSERTDCVKKDWKDFLSVKRPRVGQRNLSTSAPRSDTTEPSRTPLAMSMPCQSYPSEKSYHYSTITRSSRRQPLPEEESSCSTRTDLTCPI